MRHLFRLWMIFWITTQSLIAQDYWHPVNLPSPVTDVLLIRTDDGDLFCGTREHGVYRSQDQGATWTASGTGLPDDPTTTDLADAPGNMLYLAASDQSLFRKTFPVGMLEHPRDNPYQVRIGPNPAHGNVTFTISLPKTERVSLTILDAHGIQCNEVFQGVLSGGISTISYETTGLPAGLYTYLMLGGKTVQTGKLIIL